MEAVELVQGLYSVFSEYGSNGDEKPTDSSDDENEVWILRNPTVRMKVETRVEVQQF